ncbi:MAG: hypothetical protein GX094_09050 [Clostridiales bacterium]|nr:hypothetical protein [Clostridiales bacterium]
MIFQCSHESSEGYAPPVLGNGDISIFVDYQGVQFQHDYFNIMPSVWWAGRRYDTPLRDLVPFGHFEQRISCGGEIISDPEVWTQTLNIEDAYVGCKCKYKRGIHIESEIFVHSDINLIGIKKKFHSLKELQYSFQYILAGPGEDYSPPKRMIFTSEPNIEDGSIDIEYEIDGQNLYKGIISILSDKSFISDIDKNVFSLQGSFSNEEVHYFILFVDNVEYEDYKRRASELKALVKNQGFDGLFDQHKKSWSTFWDRFYVNIPETKVQRSYYTSQYHLRTAMTKWSLPIAISNSHWYGKYFAFDEFFGFLGLLSSNHIELAKRVPEFRYQGLGKALDRSSKYFEGSDFKGGARYPWETVETGDEAAPSGFWLDHIFHISHVALEAWYYFLFSNDHNFLRDKGYPIIKACADFYLYQAVYKLSTGKTIIGKCTDLERLGVAVQNAYMTTCAAISALLTASKSAAILKVDAMEADRWYNVAHELLQSLPHDNKKYLPYPGCEEKSIAVLSGLFPYNVIDVHDEKQLEAIHDFCREESSYGNMYPVGKSICPWYASWKAVVFARLHDANRAVHSIRQAADSAGCFSELFEINEPGVIAIRPWFSTAEGTYIQGINEMLVQSTSDKIWIAPAVPFSWDDYSFKLACVGAIQIEVEVRNRKLSNLTLSVNLKEFQEKRTIIIPCYLVDKEKIRKDADILSVVEKDTCLELELLINKATVKIV